ncbi:TPA: hypothetical protein ACTXXA_003510 [Legionella anisa]
MENNLIARLSEIKTPAFVYAESFHLTQINLLVQKINQQKINTRIYYSVKTNDSKFVLEQVAKHISGMEVISLRELELVNSIPNVKKIIVNGPGKNENFLRKAVDCGAYIYIDNENEFYLLEKILKEKNQCINVGLRLMYGNSISDNKFGISTNSSFYTKLLLEKDTYNSYIKITGLHSHVSSYEESYDAFQMRISDMKIRVGEFENNGFFIDNINIGGGFEPLARLNYQMEWEPIDDFDKKISLLKNVLFSEPGFLMNKSLIIEPGRALSEGAILGIGEVVTIKSSNETTFVFINFSTAFAGGSHPAESCINMLVLEKKTGKIYPLEKDIKSKIMLCGPLCSGNDNFGFCSDRDFSIGDRIILLNAGAYTLSFRWHGPEKLPEITYI